MSEPSSDNAESSQQAPAKDIAPHEKFFRFFRHEVTNIQELITRLPNTSTTGGERSDAVDHCLASIARLSQEVKDASSYIPAYDQRTYGETIKVLGTKLQDARDALEPKKKFSFKNRGQGGPSALGGRRESMFTATKNESAISLQDAAELASERRRDGGGHIDGHRDDESGSSFPNTPADLQSPASEALDEVPSMESTSSKQPLSQADLARIRQPSFSQSNSINISNHDSMHIILPVSAAHATSSGTLSMLTRCIVDMSKPTASVRRSSVTGEKVQGRAFQTLTIKNTKDSLLICGHVHGAAHVTNLTNSVVVVASRQFRMHNSRDCDVYLLCASRPIIEDCSRIRFAPLPENYMSAEDESVENLWQSVDDFKWLKAEPSPNWSELPEEKRVGEKVWTDVVPGGPTVGVEEILTAVGLSG